MANIHFVSASKCEKAAMRLSKYLDCVGIMAYARKVRNPHDLDMLSQVVSKVGLFMHCDQDDLNCLIDYIDDLAAEKYRPAILKQYNRDCQQFYGEVSNPNFYTHKSNRSNRFSA